MKWFRAIFSTFIILAVSASLLSPPDWKPKADPATFPSTEVETEDLEVTIISTVDGNLHGIDKFGRRVWTSSLGEPMLAAHNRVDAASQTALDVERTRANLRKYAVLPTVDGSLIYSSLEGMRKTQLSAKVLAEQSPFFSREGVSFTGTTRTRMMSFDARSGDVLFDSEKKLRTVRKSENAVPVWFGRVDYFVRAVDVLSGFEEFNVSYSEVHPIPYEPSYADLAALSSEAPVVDIADDADSGLMEDAAGLHLAVAQEASVMGRKGREPTVALSSQQGTNTTAPTISESSGSDGEGSEAKRGRGGNKKRGKRRRSTGYPGNAGNGNSMGRKRRGKNRSRMEQRAGEARQLRDRLVQAALSDLDGETAITALDPDSLALISTPDGELYFSDDAGAIVDRVPLSLQSPAMYAFNLQRETTTGAEGQQDAWSIRSLGVHHRMLTTPGAGSQQSAAGTPSTAAVAVSRYDTSPAGPGPAAEITVVVRTSASGKSASAFSALFAMEVTELEAPELREEERERAELRALQQALIEGSSPLALPPVPGSGPASTADTGRPPLTGPVRRLAHELLREHSGSISTSQRSPGSGLGKRRKRGQASAGLVHMSGVPTISEGETAVAVAGPVQDVGTVGGAPLSALPSAPGESQQLAPLAASLPAGMRGHHTLRPEVYDGALFHPDERMSLFAGILSRKSAAFPRPNIAEQNGLSYASKAGDEAERGDRREAPLPAAYDPRWRWAHLSARVSAAAQQLLMTLLALVVVALVALTGAVLLLRSHPDYAARFPAEQPLAAQVAVLAYTMLGGSALLASTPTATPLQSKRARVRRVRSQAALLQKLPAVSEAAEALGATVAADSVGPATALTAMAQPVTPMEGRDEEGRRTLQVGTLVVLPDCVLGYGSHGTVVYRGSLHGRPLAVKRVLSQFVKAADRYADDTRFCATCSLITLT
jgi:hypothetical protein